ncbi:MAG TPA: HAMP domain-containing sensor histidine kinase [Ramlibacter sp.]|nr:HAMP domain-containing sensor histidine kinase [Ramlibacter sp.]
MNVLPKLEIPRLGLASFRRRILFRGVFLLLAVATLALAVVLLKEEKERSYQNYRQGFGKTQAEVLARLRHPAGLLALLNPTAQGAPTPLRPLMLPYGALDFDDQNKAQQAVEMAGCSVRYPDNSTICAAIGNNPYAGGFIYLVGTFAVGELWPRERGMLDLFEVHRATVSLTVRGETTKWVAPFEALSDAGAPVARGRLTGFVDTGEPTLASGARPVRDFRGWLWQSGRCVDAARQPPECPRRAFFSIRLPVDSFQQALFAGPRPVWPPPELDTIRVHMKVLGPGSDKPLFDSDAEGAVPPASLDDLRKALLPGETLTVQKLGPGKQTPLVLKGEEDGEPTSPLITRLIRRLPVDGAEAPAPRRDVITTPLGSYEVTLTGDARGIERGLGAVATRVSWYVGAMLAAIALAWLVIEVGLIRRITVLTKRAAAVSYNVQDARIDERIGRIDVSDLRGSDELGILAGGLSDLLQRVKDDVQREEVRAQREREMLQAVGHEILSPLQSLMVLHPHADDAGHRYVQRMQQAVKVLYGQASPSEALQAANLELGAIDLDEFLHHVASNAHFAGIAGVRYQRAGTAVMVRADEFSLEDVVTHVLRNADRHRRPGTPITLHLDTRQAGPVQVAIHNEGEAIAAALLERIFEYGVSGAGEAAATGQRGQGLFVARTYMSKMGGAIEARNDPGGVTFLLTLQRLA